MVYRAPPMSIQGLPSALDLRRLVPSVVPYIRVRQSKKMKKMSGYRGSSNRKRGVASGSTRSDSAQVGRKKPGLQTREAGLA